MKITQETSNKIANMSVVCAMLVVFNHVYWDKAVGSAGWYVSQIIEYGFATIPVQFFFLVSGFFLSFHFDEEGWWKREVLKRCKSLLVPMYIWIAIGLLAPIPLQMLADALAHRPLMTTAWGLLASRDYIDVLGFNLATGPTPGPLWYLRCLFFFVLMSPVFKYLVRRFGMAWLVFAFVVMSIGSTYREFLGGVNGETPVTGFFNFGFSARGMFYFSLGMYIHDHPMKLPSKAIVGALGLLGCALIGVRTAMNYHGLPMVLPLTSLFTPCIMLCMWRFTPSAKMPKLLAGSAFPIYLMHVILFDYVRCAVNFVYPACSDNLMNWCCVVGAIVCAIAIKNIVSRNVSAVLYCGRG